MKKCFDRWLASCLTVNNRDKEFVISTENPLFDKASLMFNATLWEKVESNSLIDVIAF